MHLIVESFYVPYVCYAWLVQTFWYVARPTVVRVRGALNAVYLFIEFRVCSSFLQFDLTGNISHWSCGARFFLVPNLFWESPHLPLPLHLMHRGEYLLASQMRIPINGIFVCYMGWSCVSRDTKLYVAIVPWGHNLLVVIMGSCWDVTLILCFCGTD